MAAYDLAALWDAHCRYEFETRDVDATMSTMVDEPYVNHVPTMTGGVGFEKLRHFYAHHFIGVNPPDFELVPVSRTVGESSLVDEFIVRFTHTTRMDYMLPGIEPTGRRVEVPTVAIVEFQDGKLVHEHIYWDQASVLVQLGVLDPNGLPIAGAETARKVRDVSLPSNTLMKPWQWYAVSAGRQLRLVRLVQRSRQQRLDAAGGHDPAARRLDCGATSFGSASDLATAQRRAESAHGEHEKRAGQRDAN